MAKPSRHAIAKALLSEVEKGRSAGNLAKRIAEYLVAEGRTRELGAITRELEKLRFEKDGILEANVLSARQLDDKVKKQITKLLAAKKVIIDTSLDPELVGGVRVRALDRQLDISIEAKLNKLRHADAREINSAAA